MTQPAGPYAVTVGLQGPPGPAGGVVASASSVANLSTINDSQQADGALALVTATRFRALWRLDKSSALTIDGVTVVATLSGVGRWVINSRYTGFIPVTECGADPLGVSDSTTAIQAVFTATAGTGVASYLTAGTFKTSTPLTMASGLIIIGCAGTIINSTMSQTGTEANDPLTAPQVTATSTTTLTSAVTLETTQIQVAAANFSIGSIVRIRSTGSEGANHILLYKVLSTANAGLSLNLDRPVKFPFQNGDNVDLMPSRPSDITIYGNGMTIAGTGDTALQLWGATRVHIQDVNVNGNFANWGITVDLGCDNIHVENYRISGTSQGFASSSNELARFVHCNVQGSSGAGFTVDDGIDVTIEDCNGNASVASGMLISTNNVSTTVGGQRTHVIRGNYDRNGTIGIWVAGSSVGTEILGASVQNNQICGIYANGCDVDIVDCVVGPAIAGSSGSALPAQGISSIMPAIYADTGAIVHVRGGRCIANGGASGGTSQSAVCSVGAATRVYVSDYYVNVAALAPSAFLLTFLACDDPSSGGSVMHTTRVQMAGTQVGNANTFGFYTSTHGTHRIGPGCDVGGVQSANQLAGGTLYSRKQTVIANGTSGVAVSFPDIKAQDAVQFTLKTIGGTVGHPKYTISAGTGFTLTSDASDTSTYEWYLQ